MLSSLENLACFRQNEPEFRGLHHSLQQARRLLQKEYTDSMKDRTIDSFFHPASESTHNDDKSDHETDTEGSTMRAEDEMSLVDEESSDMEVQ
jgi:hypothetical protein